MAMSKICSFASILECRDNFAILFDTPTYNGGYICFSVLDILNTMSIAVLKLKFAFNRTILGTNSNNEKVPHSSLDFEMTVHRFSAFQAAVFCH